MKKNILIAVAVIASIAMLVWGIQFLKGINLFNPANYYIAKFNNVQGLTIASPVTVNGYQIGLVEKIEYDYQHNQIQVTLNMDEEFRIPIGAELSLEKGLINGSQLILQMPNNPSKFYELGAEIPTRVNAGLIDQLSGQMVPQVAAILPKIDSILSNVNTLTANPALAKSVSDLSVIMAQLNVSSQELAKLMTLLNKQVPGVMNNVNSITGEINTSSANLTQFTNTLNGMPIDSTMQAIHRSVNNIEMLTKQLQNKSSSLGLLLNDDALYRNATNSVASLDSLLKDVKKNPKRYVTIKVF